MTTMPARWSGSSTPTSGEMPAEFGGGRYHALDPHTYYWAHATFFDQVLYFTDTFVKRLSRAEKEQMYRESKTWYRRYGVSDRPMPADFAAFEKYWDHMINDVPSLTEPPGTASATSPRASRSPGCLPGGVENRCAGVQSARRIPDHRWHAAGTREILGLPWDARKSVATNGSRRSAAPRR